MRILDVAALAAGLVDEDRAGTVGDLAWVIDSATDVVDAPLTSYPTDASWIAETLDTQLRDLARRRHRPRALPATLAPRLATAFRRDRETAALSGAQSIPLRPVLSFGARAVAWNTLSSGTARLSSGLPAE